MAASKFFSIGNAIRIMILGGLLAILFVIVQSCQVPKTGLQSYATGSLRKLDVMDNPPPQPDVVFTDETGAEFTLADFKGKTILVNVWATWCPPCVAEMPTLNALQVARGGDTFEVIAISADRIAQEPQDWFKANDITALTPYHDGSYALAGRLRAQGLPISIIYDKNGKEIARVSGEADWASPEALALIDSVKE